MHKSSDEKSQGGGRSSASWREGFSFQIKLPVTSPPTAPEEAKP